MHSKPAIRHQGALELKKKKIERGVYLADSH
jgi:hypothetical protein